MIDLDKLEGLLAAAEKGGTTPEEDSEGWASWYGAVIDAAPALIAAARALDAIRETMRLLPSATPEQVAQHAADCHADMLENHRKYCEVQFGGAGADSARIRSLLEYGLACAEALESEGWRMVDGKPLKDRIAGIRAELGGKSDG